MALMIPDMKCTIILIALLKGKCAFISHQFRTDSLLSSFIVSLPFSVTISKISMPIAMSTRVFRNLDSNSLSDFLPGLKIKLMPHQVLGVSFMVEKERDHRYRGGLNGDSMGLGKTVQSIATMVANPSQDVQCKTTLIIAPLALLSQ